MINNCLFRYRSHNEFTLKEILYNELWFSSVKNLNDPFEFPFFFSREYNYSLIDLLYTLDKLKVRGMDELIQFSKSFNETSPLLREFLDGWIDQLELKVRKDILETNVCCFTKKSDNSLMWSHYADGMKGLCIAYDKQLLSDSDILLEEIKYVDSIKKAHIYNFELKDTEKSTIDNYHATIVVGHNELYKYSYFKHHNWKYEEELRSIIIKYNDKYKSDGQIIKIKKNTIKGVIVGYKMPEYNKRIVEMICKSKNIELYMAIPNLKNFTVSYKPYKTI